LEEREKEDFNKAKEEAVLRALKDLHHEYLKRFDEMFSYDEVVKINSGFGAQ
jgi:hypothetical protein